MAVESASRPRRGRRWLGALLTAAMVAGLVAVVWGRRDELLELVEDPSGDLAVIAALVVIGHFLNSAEFYLLYRAQGVAIGLWENWMVFTAGQLGNLLPGQLGSVYKFRYMRVTHGLAYVKSASNYGANLLITFASSAIAGLVGLAMVAADGGEAAPWLVAVFVGLGATSLGLLVIPVPHLSWLPAKVARVWAGFREGWDELRGQPATALGVLALDLGKYVLVSIRFQVAFALLGVDEPLWYFLVIAPAAGMAGALAVTPAALGFREVFVTAAAVGLGSELDTGLLAATVDRGVLLAAALVLGSVGYVWTSRRMRRAALNGSPGAPAADEPAPRD